MSSINRTDQPNQKTPAPNIANPAFGNAMLRIETNFDNIRGALHSMKQELPSEHHEDVEDVRRSFDKFVEHYHDRRSDWYYGAKHAVGHVQATNRVFEAMRTGPRHPDYTMLILGEHGAGKTTLLNKIEKETQDNLGWVTLSATGDRPDLCFYLASSALTALKAVAEASNHQAQSPVGQPDLRSALTSLSSAVETARYGGVLLLVDDFHNAEIAQARELAATIQHVTRREERPVAFVASALPEVDDGVLADSGMIFFQRLARANIRRSSG